MNQQAPHLLGKEFKEFEVAEKGGDGKKKREKKKERGKRNQAGKQTHNRNQFGHQTRCHCRLSALHLWFCRNRLHL
jgi:hypothetical protein